MTDKRKRPSRWQALSKSVIGWFLCRPWLLKWMVRVARLALFLWGIWHKLKNDLWTIYDEVGVAHAA